MSLISADATSFDKNVTLNVTLFGTINIIINSGGNGEILIITFWLSNKKVGAKLAGPKN